MKKTQDKNTQILNLEALENKLGVKLAKKTKTISKFDLKKQITTKINQKIHELLLDEFSEYYKEIETQAITTSKNETQIKDVRGYRLMIPKADIEVGDERMEGYAIGTPTLYVDGINTTNCLYFKEVGKTTNNK